MNEKPRLRPLTWYVIDPRDEPCCKVNPRLYQEFLRQLGLQRDQRVTEAECVQWLDQKTIREADEHQI